MTVLLLGITTPPMEYETDSPPIPKSLIEFECRGCELIQFRPDGNWEAVGAESGTRFEHIDLSEGEWFDYDQKSGEEVSIRDIKWEIKKA